MLNDWDGRRGWDGEESNGSLREGGLSDKSSNGAVEKIPDPVGLSYSGLEACCDGRLGIE